MNEDAEQWAKLEEERKGVEKGMDEREKREAEVDVEIGPPAVRFRKQGALRRMCSITSKLTILA